MMTYAVLRALRWRGKNYEKNEIITPRNVDEEERCRILAEMGQLAPVVSNDLLRNLKAVGVRIGAGERVRPVVNDEDV